MDPLFKAHSTRALQGQRAPAEASSRLAFRFRLNGDSADERPRGQDDHSRLTIDHCGGRLDPIFKQDDQLVGQVVGQVGAVA
jgi:hypothetical protein